MYATLRSLEILREDGSEQRQSDINVLKKTALSMQACTNNNNNTRKINAKSSTVALHAASSRFNSQPLYRAMKSSQGTYTKHWDKGGLKEE